MKKYDVVGVGLNIIDLLFISPENVVADGKQFVEDFVMQGGAPIGSAVSAIARMGYKAAFAARMDNSALSSIARSELRSNNISDDLVITDSKSKPAIAIVSIDKKTSGRTVYIGMKDYGFLRKKDIPVEAIRNSKLLMADSYDFDATEAALAAAAKCGCRSLVDFEYSDKKRTLKVIGMATDIVLPLECACRLSGKKDAESALKALAKYTDGQLVATDGKRGSWALVQGGIYRQGIVPESASVDSTGCGDAFHAGYGIGLIEGWDLPLRMECGAWLASLVITKLGGRTALPFKKDIAKYARAGISKQLRAKLLEISKRK